MSATFFLIGKSVGLEDAKDAGVSVVHDGLVLGYLDASLSSQVAAAIAQGWVFLATVTNGFPAFMADGIHHDGAYIDIKAEYMLDSGQPAIEQASSWRAVYALHEALTSPKSFFTKVAGVTFEGRQRIIARCIIGEPLTLVRDPAHKFDPGAIKVLRANGEQLGFIPAHVSRGAGQSGLSDDMDRGRVYRCRISGITGGGDLSLGVNIELITGEFIEPVSSVPTPAIFQSAATPKQPGVGAVLLAALILLLLIIATAIYIVGHTSF